MNAKYLSYPTLTSPGRHYPDSAFHMEVMSGPVLNQEKKQVSLVLQFHLTAPTLRDLITEGKAIYAIVIVCKGTFRREFHHLVEQDNVISLDYNDYEGQIQIYPYVLATADLVGFSAPEHASFLRELSPGGFNLKAGSQLASAPPYSIGQPDPVDSLVDLQAVEDMEAGGYRIDLDGRHVTISLDPATYNLINQIREGQRDDMAYRVLFLSLYQDAVAEGIRKMKSYPDNQWHRGFRDALQHRGIIASADDPLDYDDLDENALTYAQRLLDNPLGKFLGRYQQSREDG